jgi:hypothetical protein
MLRGRIVFAGVLLLALLAAGSEPLKLCIAEILNSLGTE